MKRMNRVLLLVALASAGVARAQDMPLSQILIPGESWRAVTKLEGKPGALLSDGTGKLLVADAEKPIVRVLDVDERIRGFWTPSGVVRAMCRDAEGGIYATIPERKRIVRFDGKMELTVHDLDAQDVAMVGKVLYYTDAARRSVMIAGRAKPVAGESQALGGLVGWSDGGTLVVGEAGGKHLLTYRIRSDGTLDGRERYYPLRVRGKDPSEVRQLTVDASGRLYAATREGVQVYDPTGRMSGVLVSPGRAAVTAVALVGERLYIVCEGKLWWRKTKTRGS